MTSLPPSVRAAVEDSLLSTARPGGILSATPVGGGCINRGHRLELEGGERYFLKWNPGGAADLFPAESDGLRALRAAGSGLRVPEPIAWGEASDGTPWLLLEYIESGAASSDTDAALGRGLAALHAAGARHPTFGWHRDNRIGSLPQLNAESDSWAEFWRDRRIIPQLEAARRRGLIGAGSGSRADASLDLLVDLIPTAVEGVDGPELLHGDLWSGNTFASTDGEPVVIDPAVYRGDGEVDLAMTELFGGFGPSFFDAYAEARPISDAYRSQRRDLYQLYYLLVHVNLFGASYVPGTLRAASRVVSALR